MAFTERDVVPSEDLTPVEDPNKAFTYSMKIEEDLSRLHFQSPDSTATSTDPSWSRILNAVLAHSDAHLIKLERALTESGKKYGGRPKLYFSGTTLEGVEELDGSVLWRVAKINMDHFGWVGQRKGPSPL